MLPNLSIYLSNQPQARHAGRGARLSARANRPLSRGGQHISRSWAPANPHPPIRQRRTNNQDSELAQKLETGFRWLLREYGGMGGVGLPPGGVQTQQPRPGQFPPPLSAVAGASGEYLTAAAAAPSRGCTAVGAHAPPRGPIERLRRTPPRPRRRGRQSRGMPWPQAHAPGRRRMPMAAGVCPWPQAYAHGRRRIPIAAGVCPWP